MHDIKAWRVACAHGVTFRSMQRLRIALAVAVLALSSPTLAQQQKRACEESGYCSVGHSRKFVGDIKDSAKFREALEAVSYKREVIITIYMKQQDAVSIWADQALQLHYELMDMGYAHHFFIALGPEGCEQLNEPDLSCIWDSSYVPTQMLVADGLLWHNRWKFTARAMRLGYNVLSVDSDTIFFRDFYYHVKRPPLADVNLMCNPESGTPYGCNGGFMYVQNARPDGPASWVLFEVARAALRRADDGYEYLSQWTGHKGNCLGDDQAQIDDAMSTAAVGRPVPRSAVNFCKRTANFTAKMGAPLTLDQVNQNLANMLMAHSRARTTHSKPDEAWLQKLGFSDVPPYHGALVRGTLTVPNLNYGWPEELGGSLYPPGPPGKLSSEFLAQLRSDCPQCPWWPEERPLHQPDPLVEILGRLGTTPFTYPRGQHDMFRDPSIALESHALTPKWLAASLANVRTGTFLGRGASERQGTLAIGHVHAWHMQSTRQHKTMPRKVVGRYNWTLGFRVARSYNLSSAYLYPKPVLRVLALSPSVDLSRTRSWEELSSIITGLIQVAHLSQRVLLMPDLPCETAWLHPGHTLNNPSTNTSICVAPTLWAHALSFPLPVTVPVDERGELIGGWARRLQSTSDAATPDRWLISDLAGHQPPPHSAAHARSRRGNGSGSAAGSDSGVVGGHSIRRLHVAINKRYPFTSDAWWLKQRYMAVMPQLWDMTCTDLRAIISAEFFHWLKHTQPGKAAKFPAQPKNTVLQAAAGDPALTLTPPVGDKVNPGHVRKVEATPGWSWRDVQAAVPADQVVKELARVSSEPLVYVGHPVMVVPTASSSTTAASSTATTVTDSRSGAQPTARTSAGPTPDQLLTRVNTRIQMTKCKAVWTMVETHSGTVVNLTWGVPSEMRDSRIHSLKTTQPRL